MAETMLFKPMRAGSEYSAPSLDDTRLSFEIEGTLATSAGETDIGGNAQNLMVGRVVTSRATLEILKSLWPAYAEPRKDDQFTAVEKDRDYKIDSIDRQHASRIIFHLSILKAAG